MYLAAQIVPALAASSPFRLIAFGSRLAWLAVIHLSSSHPLSPLIYPHII